MPPQQHRFEGADLEALLEEVRETYGGNARFVEANKLRRGGIAGFFTQERFEVIIEVDESASGDAPTTTAAPVDIDLGSGVAAPAPAATSTTPPRSLLEWADQISDGEQPRTTVSTEGGDFADVLARLTQSTDHTPAPTPPAPAPAPAPTAAVPPVAVAAAPEPAPAPTAAVAVRPEPTPTDLATIDVRPLVAAGIPADLARRGEVEPDLLAALERVLADLPQPETLPDLPGAVVAVVGKRSPALALGRQLAGELGLSPDSVLLASTRYEGPDVADHRRVDTPEHAVERRRGLRRRTGPTVVVIDATAGRGDGDWASRMLDSFEVTMTWATLEAARKPEDVQDWARRLGGVDALALTETDRTVSPAAVLHTGIPVGRLDGVAATPDQWLTVLFDRIAA